MATAVDMGSAGQSDDSVFALAHISDLHLSPIPSFPLRHLNVKRGLGYLNWRRNRREVHKAEVAAKLVDDIHKASPDHIAVTGDLVNIALPGEFDAATRWLHDLGSPEVVSLVPGNHDIYVRGSSVRGVARWQAYMTGDDHDGDGQPDPPNQRAVEAWFPYVRRRGPIAIVGVNSAEPTPPFAANGRVQNGELQLLADVLTRLESEGLFRCVLIHHPPLPGLAPPRRALRNAKALAEVFRQTGVELVLHGHNHSNRIVWGEGRTRSYPVVGVCSGSAARIHGNEPLARYNLIRLSQAKTEDAKRWRIEITSRGLSEPAGEVKLLERTLLTGESPENVETEGEDR